MKKTDTFYRVWPHNFKINNTWNVTDVNIHARKRRVLNNAFSDRALRGAEPLVQSNVDRWLDLIQQQTEKDKQWSPSFNMAHEANNFVFDVLGDLCFGRCFNMKEPESDLKHIPSLMTTFLELMHPVRNFSQPDLLHTDGL